MMDKGENVDKEFKLASQLLTLLDSEQRWFTLAEVEKVYIFQIRPYVSSLRRLISNYQQG